MKSDVSTEKKLILAAKKLFAKHNYDYVSTRMIATKAGVGQSAIFFHFSSKENLAKAVIENICQYHDSYYADIFSRVTEYLKDPSDKEQALELLMEYLRIEIDLATNPANDKTLSLFVNSNAMPEDIVRPLMERTRDQLDMPLAKLLCAYKGTDNFPEAFAITHSITSAIITYHMTLHLNYYKGIDVKPLKSEKDFLLEFYRQSLINAKI